MDLLTRAAAEAASRTARSANKSARGLALMRARQREAEKRHSPAWLTLHGHRAFIVCPCLRRVEIDLLGYALAERDHVDLRWERFVCSACGERGGVVIEPTLGEPWRWRC